MTKQEFIESYCSRSNITWEALSKHRVCLPCSCDEPICEGWVMVPNDHESIDFHNRIHGLVEGKG